MKRLTAVQVGTWRYTHAADTMNTMRSMPHVYDVLGVCEPNDELRAEAMQRSDYQNLRWLTMDEIFELKPDVVMVEAHELEQAKLALPFAEKGYHLHIDKPGGGDPKDFARLVELSKQNNTVLQLGYMYRNNPAISRALEIVRSGRLGELICIEAQMSQCYNRTMLDFLGDLPGGMFFYLGCHLVELLYRFMGEPEKVIPMHRSSGAEGSSVLDEGLVLYEYKKGVSMLKTVACEVDGNMRRYLMISGTKGTIEIQPIECPIHRPPIEYANNVTLKCTTRSETHPGVLFAEETRFGPYGRYDDMLYEFARVVNGEIENPYTPEIEQAVHTLFLRSCGILN